jgi:hypothetical protein
MVVTLRVDRETRVLLVVTMGEQLVGMDAHRHGLGREPREDEEGGDEP